MGVCNLDASAIAAYGRWKGRQTGRQAGGRAGRELCNCPALGMWPLNSSIYIYIYQQPSPLGSFSSFSGVVRPCRCRPFCAYCSAANLRTCVVQGRSGGSDLE